MVERDGPSSRSEYPFPTGHRPLGGVVRFHRNVSRWFENAELFREIPPFMYPHRQSPRAPRTDDVDAMEFSGSGSNAKNALLTLRRIFNKAQERWKVIHESPRSTCARSASAPCSFRAWAFEPGAACNPEPR